MEEIWNYLVGNWYTVILVIVLMVAANCQGRTAELKKFNQYMEKHIDWLRGSNDALNAINDLMQEEMERSDASPQT